MIQHIKGYILLFLILTAYISTPLAETLPNDTKKKSLSSDQVNLTAEAFFSEFTSKTESDREKAKLYLLGVQDITEGKSWCDYKTLKTITLQEFVFEYFKKLPPARMKERASNIIEEALHKSFPCKVKK